MSGSFLLPAAGWIWAMLARRAGNPVTRPLACQTHAGRANPTPAHLCPGRPDSPRPPAASGAVAGHAGSTCRQSGDILRAESPLTDLQAYDHIVVEPAALNRAPAPAGNRWYAYVSVGEVAAQREYRNRMPAHWLAGHNRTGTVRSSTRSQPDWRAFCRTGCQPIVARAIAGCFSTHWTATSGSPAPLQAQLAQQQG